MVAIVFAMLGAWNAQAGDWSRISKDTIKFSGGVEVGEIDRYRSVASVDDKILIVDSRGGDTEAGLELGMALARKKLTIVVDGMCVSTCANYIFTAGEKREVRRGFVGYHGNITAFLALDWRTAEADLKSQNVPDQEIQRLRERFQKSARLEKLFLENRGVQQKLFDETQLKDKGKGDGREYHFLIPRLETFAKYGIKGVLGQQHPEYSEELGLVSLYD